MSIRGLGTAAAEFFKSAASAISAKLSSLFGSASKMSTTTTSPPGTPPAPGLQQGTDKAAGEVAASITAPVAAASTAPASATVESPAQPSTASEPASTAPTAATAQTTATAPTAETGQTRAEKKFKDFEVRIENAKTQKELGELNSERLKARLPNNYNTKLGDQIHKKVLDLAEKSQKAKAEEKAKEGAASEPVQEAAAPVDPKGKYQERIDGLRSLVDAVPGRVAAIKKEYGGYIEASSAGTLDELNSKISEVFREAGKEIVKLKGEVSRDESLTDEQKSEKHAEINIINDELVYQKAAEDARPANLKRILETGGY